MIGAQLAYTLLAVSIRDHLRVVPGYSCKLTSGPSLHILKMKAAHLHAGTPVHVPPAKAGKQQANSPAAGTPLWQAHYEVGKFPTELIGVQATQTPAAQLLVVPGNPGYAGFYAHFMHQLHGAFNGAADVLAVSHVGHDAEDISRGAVWGLGCQVQHKAQLVRELTSPGRPPLVILAHSIGAYIMLQAVQQLKSEGHSMQQVAKVFLLMPFLTTHWASWEQRVLAAAARQHGRRLAAAAGWVQGSPGWVQDRVVGAMLPGAEPHAEHSLRTALNERGCANNWHMAAQEFSVLDAPVDWGLIKQLGRKAAVVYNPADPWFQQYHDMQQALPGLEMHAMDDLSHAFCLSSAENSVVSQLAHHSITAGAGAVNPAADRLAVTGRGRAALREAAAPSSA